MFHVKHYMYFKTKKQMLHMKHFKLCYIYIMKLEDVYIGYSNVKYILEYEDCDDFTHLDYLKCKQCYGVCFTGNNQIVIGFGGHKNSWGLIGGTIEPGETFEDTLKREIQEESNMEVLSYMPIGYQKVIDTRDNSYIYQLRFMCNVKPFGPFVEDPAQSVTKIEIIDIKDYKKYFDWGKIGERILNRALELYISNVSHETK